MPSSKYIAVTQRTGYIINCSRFYKLEIIPDLVICEPLSPVFHNSLSDYESATFLIKKGAYSLCKRVYKRLWFCLLKTKEIK